MITIRSSKNISEPTLIGLEATLAPAQGVYELSSDDPIVDPASPGGIAWSRSRFQIDPGLVLEQQMFVSQATPDIAISWELRGELVPVSLTIRPYFVGCAPRGYRDIGFHFNPEEEGGRLVWLPSVCRSKIIADTNGRYSDEPVRSAEAIAQTNPTVESLVAPGRFEFDLNYRHPSVLIFSSEGGVRTQTQRFVGTFLSNLMRPAPGGIEVEAAQTAAESVIAS